MATYLSPHLRRIFYSATIRRLLHFTAILTVLITASIVYRFKGSPPSNDLVNHVWYTDKFKMTIPRSVPNAVLWRDDQEDEDTSNNATRQVLAEFHTHTTCSDGRLKPAQVVDWAIAYGFQVLFVTDHNTVEGGLQAQAYAKTLSSPHHQDHLENNTPLLNPSQPHQILVIPGVEYSCCRIHMNLLGINQTIKPTRAWPSDTDIQQAIQQTHALGGIVVVNHLQWSLSNEYGRHVSRLQNHPTRDQLVEWGVDAFESVSEGVLDLSTVRYTEKIGMPYITATDLHDPDTVPTAWTVLNIPVGDGIKPTKQQQQQWLPTQQQVLDLLRSRTPRATNFYYSASGPPPLYKVYTPHNPAAQWSVSILLTRILDFTVFWSESNGLYSFVPGDHGSSGGGISNDTASNENHSFCHTHEFTFHWRMIVTFIGWMFILFFIHEAIVISLGYRQDVMDWISTRRQESSITL